MATIYDVAKEAKVAVSTVSYVLNNTKPVSEATRDKILKAIEKLNYTPSSIARSLKTKTTLTIGVIVPDISNPFFSEIIKGIEDTASKRGYMVFICNTYENYDKQIKYLEMLFSKNIDGLIFVSTAYHNKKIINNSEIPIVFVDRRTNIETKNSGYVMINNEKGAYIATNFLIQKGCKEIILLSGPLNINTYMDRLSGYKKALTENDMLFVPDFVYQVTNNDVSIEQGYNILMNVIKSGKKFDGIFASNDLIAIGAIQALQEKGITIPDDVKVIGFDDIYPASLIKPALTTISQPKYVMGCEAMNILYKLINSNKVKKREIIMEPTLKIRQSV